MSSRDICPTFLLSIGQNGGVGIQAGLASSDGSAPDRRRVNAPPVIYEAVGKEYVVIAVGGNKMFNLAPGNAVIGLGLYEQDAH